MKSIVILHDELDVALALARLLQEAGFAVDISARGLDDEASIGLGPDLLIAHVAVSSVHGIDLIRSIRKRNPVTPVLAIAGRPDATSEQEITDAISYEAYVL